jgi:acyl-CoA hydrolase
MRRLALCVAAWTVSIAMALAIPACGRKARVEPLPRDAIVVALGDSLTFGTGAAQSTSYPAVLAAISGWQVVNAGTPGETASEGCARLDALLDEHRPQLVLVLLGGNDFLRRLPEHGVVEALASCVEVARAAQTPIALLTVPRFGPSGISNAALYGELGKRLDVPVVESGLAALLGQPAMRADTVHLNAAGYRQMAGTIAEGLREHGWLAR